MIDINLYGIAKEQQGATTQSQVMIQQGGNESHSHYIWGQYCDGKKDINGDMQVNGTAYIDFVKSLKVTGDYGYFTYLNSDYANIYKANIEYLKGSSLEFDFASIMKAFISELSSKSITTENLTVTKSAHFFELVIDQIKASGGAVLFTPANGFTIRKYEKIQGGWRLYFLAEERGQRIRNMWRMNDQAICQNFNRAQAGTNYNISNKYYWALVINTNNEDNSGNAVTVNVGTDDNQDMQPCHYIDISDTTYDGILDIEIDDEIAMLGYRGEDDEARQNAIYISSYSSLDTDLKAPLIVQYKGIDDFDLSSHKYTWFSGGVTPQGELNGYRGNEIRGSFKVSDGTSIEDYVEEHSQYTTYRIMCDPQELIRDASGDLNTDTVDVKIITNNKGEVSILEVAPAGTKLEVWTIKDNVYTLYQTIQAGSNIDFTLNSTAKQADRLELRLIEVESSRVLDTMKLSIAYIDNSNTKVDRIVDTGTVTLMSYDSENETYSLQYQIKMLIYHYDGESFTSITTSTQPSASDYTIRCCLVKSDQTETNVTTYEAQNVFSNNEYRATSQKITWDRDTANYIYLKISLLKSSIIVDNLIIPITLTPSASLDIIQGETAKIVAQITGANQDWYNGYTYLSNYISLVSLTAEENKSYIGRITTYIDDLTGQVGEKVSWSYIIQHADEINLSVIDGLKTTGIDITSGQINLNAENTNIIGNLNLRGDNNNGIKIYDSNGSVRISLQPKSAGQRSNFDFSESHFKNGYSTWASGNTSELIIRIGDYSEGNRVNLDNLFLYTEEKDNWEGVSLNASATVKIELVNLDNDNVVYDYGQYSVNRVTSSSNDVYPHYSVPTSLVMSSLLSQSYSNLGIKSTFTIQDTNKYISQWRQVFDFQIVKGVPSLTFVGTDAIVRGKSKDKHFWFGDDEMMLRWHDMSLPNGWGTSIALGDHGFERSVNYDIENHVADFVQFDSYKPIKLLSASDFTKTSIYTGSDRRDNVYVYEMKIDDSGIFFIDNALGSWYTQTTIPWGNDLYIMLKGGFNANSSIGTDNILGRICKVKNLSNRTVYIVDGRRNWYIMHRDSIGLTDRFDIDNDFCDFISIPLWYNEGEKLCSWVCSHRA